MGTLLQDLKYAARTLWKNPGFTAVAVLALALGIGATTAIYTVVDAMLLRPLPYAQPQQLVTMKLFVQGRPFMAAYPEVREYATGNHTLSSVVGWSETPAVLTGGAQAEHLRALETTPNLFRMLGVSPVLGRGFTDDEGRVGSRVVVISYSLWQTHFNGSRDIVGKTIAIDGESRTVIGVAPRGFSFPLDVGNERQIYLPFPHTAQEAKDGAGYGWRFLNVAARMRDGVSVAQAQADLLRLLDGMKRAHPAEYTDLNVQMQLAGMHAALVEKTRPALLMLLAAVACVLLIACANVAGLLLVRATARQREIAIRAALGAGRARLMRQMLTESALLGLGGGAVGVVLALWLVDLLAALVSPALPRVHELAVDGRILAVTSLLALVTGLAFGLVPALHASRADLTGALKETARSSAHAGSRRARNSLLVAEIAIALVLLVGAGIALRSFAKLQHVDPGFRPDDLVVAAAALPDQRYGKPEQADRYYRELMRQLQALPGVQAVALGSTLPFTQWGIHSTISVPGQTASPSAKLNAVGPGYFKAMGIPIKEGRDFTSADDQLKSAPTMVVSQEFARRLFGGQSAVGKHVISGFSSDDGDSDFEIIGVVGDVLSRTLDQRVEPEMYTPLGRFPIGMVGVVARTSAPEAVIPAVRRAMLAVDEQLPPTILKTMATLTDETLLHERVLMLLLAMFAVMALLLASIGIYGVMSYTVTQRTRELGIRVALGAGAGDVLALVLGESLRLALLAIGLGLGVALALGRVVRSLMYGVSAADPLTLVPVAFLILAVCLLASFLPARRATKVDPMVALRYE